MVIPKSIKIGHLSSLAADGSINHTQIYVYDKSPIFVRRALRGVFHLSAADMENDIQVCVK